MEELQVPPDVKEQLTLTLKDYAPEIELKDTLIWLCDNSHIPCHRISIDRNQMPVPELIQYMLVEVLDFPTLGPGDKIRWLIPFSYKGINCTLAYQISGVKLYIAEKVVAPQYPLHQDPLYYEKEIIGKLNRAAKIIEKKVLNPYAETQISKGNIIVGNQYRSLDQMYRYFRQQASRSFSNKPELAHGFYNAFAMLDAYFSRLEHLLVIVLPFINFSETTSLLDIIYSEWREKYRRVFDICNEPDAKDYYDKLFDIKERFRNTFAHGGFLKKGASLYFDLPNIGILPAQITNIKDSPYFNFIPINKVEFNNMCNLFDEFDEWLKLGKVRYGILYAESGLDVRFDADSITSIKLSMKSDEDFQNMLDFQNDLLDRETNMEY